MPPIIVEDKSWRIVDGVHRHRACRRVLGDEGSIDVVVKRYANEAELLLDAIRMNATHGKNLSSFDRTRCALLAKEHKIELEELAGALSMTLDKVGKLHTEKVGKLAAKKTGKYEDRLVPLKNTIRHMQGRVLNQRQVEANDKLGGMNPAFYANQVIELLEANLVDWSDEKLVETLRRLHGVLEEKFSSST